MAIKIEFPDLNWGDPFYIKSDPEQLEHNLVGFEIDPGSTNKKGERGVAVKFKLSFQGEVATVHDFEASKERDEIKFMDSKEKDDD